MLRLVVLLSGRGSNFQAIYRATQDGALRAQVVGVLSDQPEAGGLQFARSCGIPAQAIAARGYASRDEYDRALLSAVVALQPDVVVLAGFMRILSAEFVESLRGRLLNIHPSLLPAHKGLNTHARAIEAGDTQHGATIHYVTPELDGGPAVLQGRLQIHQQDSVDTLSARVHQIEHIIYPRVLCWIADGRLTCPGGQPLLDGKALHAPQLEDFDV